MNTTQINDGGQAFPPSVIDFAHRGMTLRDYFAAKALTALMVHSFESADKSSKRAYEIADAMLSNR